MITSIQIREEVKNQLDNLKDGKKSYEEVIIELIKMAEKQRRAREDFLIESAKATADESLRITKEWEATDSTLDWEW